MADRASLDSAVAQAAEKLGGWIDILINAAGINRRYWLEDFPLDMWDEVIATNLNGTVYWAPSWSDNTCFAKVMAGLSIWPL